MSAYWDYAYMNKLTVWWEMSFSSTLKNSMLPSPSKPNNYQLPKEKNDILEWGSSGDTTLSQWSKLTSSTMHQVEIGSNREDVMWRPQHGFRDIPDKYMEPELNHEKTSGNLLPRDMLQNKSSGFLKTFKIVKVKGWCETLPGSTSCRVITMKCVCNPETKHLAVQRHFGDNWTELE